MSLAVALAIIFVGIRFILFPEAGGLGFGIPLTYDHWYGRIKGIRDIVSGLLVLGMLWKRDPLSTAIVMGIETLIPLGDLTLILTRNGIADTSHVVIHGLTAVYMIVLTALLLRNANRVHKPTA